MKYKISNSIFIAAVFLLSSCGSADSPVSKAMKDVSNAADVIKNVSKSQTIFQESAERMEELKEVAPASKEELKAWLPETIGNYKRKGYSVGDQGLADISSITGNYVDQDDENKTFDVNVIDGAGEAGGIFAMVYIAQFNRDFEDVREDGFSKSMEKDNKKAVVSQNNLYKTAELEYLEGKRYYVKLSGNQVDVDGLWAIASEMKTGRLPGL